MFTLSTYFSDFLTAIRPTLAQRGELKEAHLLLRRRLEADDNLKSIIITTFLQGSYRRATAMRPKNGVRSDVDVVVVTNLDNLTPQQALDKFCPFLETHYKGKWEQNDRSIQIDLSEVKLDLVVTAKPNDQDIALLKSMAISDDSVEEMAADAAKSVGDSAWKARPLLIPDRPAAEWQPTHPIAQIAWTWKKNAACNGHYVNVVKPIKWWRKVRHSTPEYPKGYPLEHLVGQCCPDGIQSVAEGVTLTLEEMARRYKADVLAGRVPYLTDHGVAQDVLHRLTPAEFKQFHGQVEGAAKIARAALDESSRRNATEKWQELFGDKFLLADEEPSGGFTPRKESSRLGGGNYA